MGLEKMSHIVNLQKYMTTFIKTDRQYVISKICSKYNLDYDNVLMLFNSDNEVISSMKKSSSRKNSSSKTIFSGNDNDNDNCNNGNENYEESVKMRKCVDSDGNKYLVDTNRIVYTFDVNNPKQIGRMLVDNQIKFDNPYTQI